MVPELQRDTQNTFPWNIYLNVLMQKVSRGWIIFIDDDDFLFDENSLQVIAGSLPDENSLLVYRMQYPDGRILPGPEYFGKLPFVRKNISMQCFCFHSKFCNKVFFDAKRAGDLRFLNDLLLHIDNIKWLDKIVVGLSNFGLNGLKQDLQ